MWRDRTVDVTRSQYLTSHRESERRMQNYPPTPDPRQVPQMTPLNQNPQPDASANPPTASLGALAPAQPYDMPSYAPTTPPAAPATPNLPRSNRNKLLIGGGIGCGVLLVLCMCVGLLSAIAAMGGTSTAAQSTPTVVGQQSLKLSSTSTPIPTVTPNPNVGAASYTSMVTQNSTILGDDLNTVSTECGSGQDISSCRDAVVTLREDSANFLDDLDAQPTPPCLMTVDTPLRAALNDLHTAAQEIIDGIDNYDVGKIDDGSTLMRKATTEINTATDAYKHVTCS